MAQNPGAAQAAYRLAAIYVDQTGNLDIALNLAVGVEPGDPAARAGRQDEAVQFGIRGQQHPEGFQQLFATDAAKRR